MVVPGLMIVPLPVVAMPFKVMPVASLIVQAKWLDSPGAITEGEAVKEEMTGAARAEVISLEPLPLHAGRERKNISKIVYLAYLCINKMAPLSFKPISTGTS